MNAFIIKFHLFSIYRIITSIRCFGIRSKC